MTSTIVFSNWKSVEHILPILVCLLVSGGNLFAQDQDVIRSSELIFELQEKHVHGSSLVCLSNGDLLAAWFEGSGERTADDVLIMGARKQKDADGWTTPFILADTKGIPDCNPVLFVNQLEELFLVWIAVQANRWENSILRVRTSRSYGGPAAPIWHWQDNILLNPGDEFAQEVELKLDLLPEHQIGWAAYAPTYDEMIKEASANPSYRCQGWMTRIPPLQLPDGKLLLPLYSDGLNMSLVAISDDDGQSWRPSKPIVGRGPIQPSLVSKKNGTLVAYMRDSGDAPSRVQVSQSDDMGESWSPATKTDIPNTASVFIKTLSTGAWIFVGNDLQDGRYRLALWLSEDEGKNWSHQIYLENSPQGTASYSYPCVIETSDGLIHITYSYHLDNRKSIKHVVVDPSTLIKNSID